MHKAKLKRTLDYLKAEKLEDLSCPKASPLAVERVPGFVHKDRLARSLRHERRGIHCCRTDVVESNMILKTATEQHRFYVRLKTWLVCHWCAGFIHWSALLRESRSHGFFAMELCSSTPCVVSSLRLCRSALAGELPGPLLFVPAPNRHLAAIDSAKHAIAVKLQLMQPKISGRRFLHQSCELRTYEGGKFCLSGTCYL